MDREEILAKSRAENKDTGLAFTTGVLLGSLVSVLHSIFKDSVDYGVWTVMFGMMSSLMLVKYAKLKKRHELLFGLVYAALSVCFFVFYLQNVLGVL